MISLSFFAGEDGFEFPEESEAAAVALMATRDRLEKEMGFVYSCLMEGVESGGKRIGLDC